MNYFFSIMLKIFSDLKKMYTYIFFFLVRIQILFLKECAFFYALTRVIMHMHIIYIHTCTHTYLICLVAETEQTAASAAEYFRPCR